MSTGTSTELNVTGMTCAHCVGAVTTELSSIPGVQDVAITLVSGGTSTVTVTSSVPLDPTAAAAAVDEAGYTLEA